jgi:transcriptional regulator with XRE-family HTH domain
MNLDEILGIDRTDPTQILADRLVVNDRRLLDELVERRRNLRLNQKEVAERMGVTESAVSKIESGTRDLRLATLRRYALAVGAEVNHSVRKFDVQHFGSYGDVEIDNTARRATRFTPEKTEGYELYVSAAGHQ